MAGAAGRAMIAVAVFAAGLRVGATMPPGVALKLGTRPFPLDPGPDLAVDT